VTAGQLTASCQLLCQQPVIENRTRSCHVISMRGQLTASCQLLCQQPMIEQKTTEE
jgi:hypothetical protein